MFSKKLTIIPLAAVSLLMVFIAAQNAQATTPNFTSGFTVSGGSVGVGTTAPGATLDVNGVIQGNNYLRLYAYPGYGSGSGTMYYNGGTGLFVMNNGLNVLGGVTATSFTGNGSGLTNVVASTYNGTVSSANVSSGTFGGSTGGGNFTFPGQINGGDFYSNYNSVVSDINAYNIQQINSRATGYAVFAARNPGSALGVYMIRWDGSNTLETNCNNQINAGWHAQAAVKGNYFNQAFNGNDFTTYSSVVLSQGDFDSYKAVGTQWWIVCSTAAQFSQTAFTGSGSTNYIPKWTGTYSQGNSTIYDNGNVGVGTANPLTKLDVKGKLQVDNSGTYTSYSWAGGALQTNSVEILDRVGGSTSDGVYPTLTFHDYGNGGAQFSMEGSTATLHLGSGQSNSAGSLMTSGSYFSKLKIWGGLEVTGSTRTERILGNNSLGLNNYTTVNPASNVYLYSQPNDRDSWIYLDSVDTGSNWGIYHRQIDTAVGGLPGNSIGFIGGGSSILQSYISLADGSAYFRGAVSAASFSGAMSGTLNAANVSSGTFGNNTGGGAYTFPGTVNITGTNSLTFSSYAGGWYMQDGTWLRSTNGNSVWLGSGNYGSNGGLTLGYDGAAPPAGGIITTNSVGVGTASPAATLDVRGNATVGNVLNLGNLSSVSTSAYRGITWESNMSDTNYAIFKPAGGWTQPLNIAFYTGIRIGARPEYNGTRFFNDPGMGTELMSIGNTDNNVRVANDLYVGSAGRWVSSMASHRGEGVNYVDYSRYVYNNGAYSGSGWNEPSDLGVRYASYAGSAGSATNAGNADTVDGYHAGGLIKWNTWDNGNYYGTDGNIYMGWYGNWMSNILNQSVRTDSNPTFQHIYANEMSDGNGRIYLAGNLHIDAYNGNAIYLNYYSGAEIRMYGPVWTSGDINATGNIYGASFQYSDETLKKNITTIDNPIDKIMQLRGVTFNWKKDDKAGVGVIAQDVEKVYPELVNTDKAGIKSVQYTSLVAPLIEAVKAQQKEISGLTDNVQTLRDTVKELCKAKSKSSACAKFISSQN